MCDYSLEHVASRPAKVGDKLVTTQFPTSITRGFTAVGDPKTVVCLLPGTEVAFDKPVEFDHALGFFPKKVIKETTARFRQVNADEPHMHHDALEFPSGKVVLLTRLIPGQTATVLQLPVVLAGDPEETEPEVTPVEQPAEPAEPEVTKELEAVY